MIVVVVPVTFCLASPSDSPFLHLMTAYTLNPFAMPFSLKAAIMGGKRSLSGIWGDIPIMSGPAWVWNKGFENEINSIIIYI